MISNLAKFCELYYNSTFFPVSCYNSRNELLCSYPDLKDGLNLTIAYLPALQHSGKNPDYFISTSFGYYGIVRQETTGDFLVIGPIFSTRSSTSIVHNFMHEAAIPQQYEPAIISFLTETPLLSFNQFLSALSYLHFCLNDKLLHSTTHFGISDRKKENISVLHSNLSYHAKEEHNFHNSYLFEQHYLSYIQNGEPEKLKNMLLSAVPSVKEGNLADNALRQSKNILIASATLATRSAIAGGLDIENAYQLSDIYIQEAEKMQTLEDLQNLQFAMVIDFAERVSQSRKPQGMSKEIFECVQFVSRHTNEPIHVNDVAEHVGRSRSYLSHRFKEELGFDLSAFIMRCKLEEAKSLLTYTDKSLSEISNYLCFSSQAYFQNVFKKKYGMTPLQYRKQS